MSQQNSTNGTHGFELTWFYDDYEDSYGYSQRETIWHAEKNGIYVEVYGSKNDLEALLAEATQIESQLEPWWAWTAYLWLMKAFQNAHFLKPSRDLQPFFWPFHE